MALKLLNAQDRPLGVFDAKDGDTFLGGEVVTWAAVTAKIAGGTDKAADDVNSDGYVGTTSKNRPAVTTTLSSSSRPLFLSDDGTAGYGTLLGSVVGATVGLVSTGGQVLGPSTYSGSGKVTLWGTPGYFGVTLDAVDTHADGLVPTNASLTVGTALTYTTAGLLTPDGSGQDAGGAIVGRLASFETNGSLVTTNINMVSALNSPSGSVSSVAQQQFTMATFWYFGA